MTTKKLLEKTKELIEIPSTADNPRAMREAYDFMVNFVRERAKSKTLKFIEEAASAGKSLLWTPFKRPATPDEYGVDLTNAEVAEFGGGDPSKLRAIKRLFVAIHPDRTAECIGGFINLRRNEKVHGANDTLFIVCDPPQR